MTKLHQTWPGKNIFTSCGCVIGPKSDWCLHSIIYIGFIVCITLYCIFILPYIIKTSVAIFILFFLAVCFTLVFLFLTKCTDPGIIPRRPYLQKQHNKYSIFLDQHLQAGQNQQQKRNFCDTCMIYRPPRASHCKTCDNCIQVFDHHCPFLNNCIGKRNYRFFISFLVSVIITIIIFIINIFLYIFSIFGSEIDVKVLIAILSVAVGIIVIPLLVFLGLHIYLICVGKTTRQMIKNINESQNKSQWCKVDPPLIDYFATITDTQKIQILNSLQKLKEHQKPQESSQLHINPPQQIKVQPKANK